MNIRNPLLFLAASLSLSVGCGADGDGTTATSGATSTSASGSSSSSGAPTVSAVQCREISDCGGLGTCDGAAPTGLCYGCDPGACPNGFDCVQKWCFAPCGPAAACHTGLTCLDGHCQLIDCSVDACPPPYECATYDKKCRRPSCAGGETCPSPLVCHGNGFCVEP